MNLRWNKNSGLTLMEIMISLAIVTILIAATLPVINKQLEKADEYSYYLAYKTVEKMAGQIVTLGDPSELTAQSSDIIIADAADDKSISEIIADKLNINKAKIFFTSIGNKFAKAEEYIFRSLFPNALAYSYTITNDLFSWYYDSYDQLWLAYKVCSPSYNPNDTSKCIAKTKTTQTVTNEDGTTSEVVVPQCYAPSDFDNCIGYTKSGDGLAVNEYLITEVLSSEGYCSTSSSNLSSLANYIMNSSEPSASTFCNTYVKSSCAGYKYINGKYQTVSVVYQSEEDVDVDTSADEDGYDDDVDYDAIAGAGEEVAAPKSANTGTCKASTSYSINVDTSGSSVVKASKPTFGDEWCSSTHGYYNMDNKSGDGATIECDCKLNYVMSANDEKVCCSKCSDGQKPYAKSNHTCICCSTDFDKSSGTCCPANSVYNESEGGCSCIDGYRMSNGVCVESECTSGSTMVDGVCVVNPPITKASRFCEQVENYWNVVDDESKASCSGFTTTNGIAYNKPVYDAAKGSNGTLMSIKSQVGAFGLDANGKDKIKPNILFSNGLKMWILSDKQASIPGLSFTTENITPTKNVCRNLKKSTKEACKSAGGYFCNAEKNCFSLDATSEAAMGDARNCCGSVDISDIAAAAQTTADPNAYLKNTQAYAVSGFTVFVDINGDKGNGTLWDDVYPFYIASNGTVYPAYPLDAPKGANANSSLYLGGNSSKQLPVDVYYYEATDESRERKVAFPGVSFARGVCSARQISKYTPYCLNLGYKFYAKGLDNHVLPDNYIEYDDTEATGSSKSYNPCDKYKCFVSVRRKLRSF